MVLSAIAGVMGEVDGDDGDVSGDMVFLSIICGGGVNVRSLR